MKSTILNALLCTLALLCTAIYAQDTGPCAQCRFIGNDQVLVPCSQYWRDIVDICSSIPECDSYNIDDDLIDSCTNTPLPLPPGTGTSTITAIFESSTTASAATTTRTTTTVSGSVSGTGSRSATSTASASSTSPSQTTSPVRERTSTTTNTPSGTTEPSTTNTRAPVSTTTTTSAGTFSQGASVAAVNVPGWWIEGVVLVAGWVLAL